MKWMMSMLCVFCSLTVQADSSLTVIYDSGDTRPIAPYLPKRVQPDPAKRDMPSLPFQLPILTPSMSPGTVSLTNKTLRYLQQPIFLVGSDKHSASWLAKKYQQLLELNAVGLLVQADSVEDIARMQAIAKELRMIPASAESIAKPLGLTHYPVLISKEGWEQ